MPGDPEHCLASMGIYVFNTRLMYELLCQDATKAGQRPRLRQGHHSRDDRRRQRVFAYPFRDENRKTRRLLARRRHARRLLPGQHGPDRGRPGPEPVRRELADPHVSAATAAAQVRLRSRGERDRRGAAIDSIVCQGAIVSGGQVYRSILSPRVRVNSYAMVEDSILFDGVDVGRHAAIRRAIIDKDVKVPRRHSRSATTCELDRPRGLTITDDGIVVIAKGDGLEHMGDGPRRRECCRPIKPRRTRRIAETKSAATTGSYRRGNSALSASSAVNPFARLLLHLHIEPRVQQRLDQLARLEVAFDRERGVLRFDVRCR